MNLDVILNDSKDKVKKLYTEHWTYIEGVLRMDNISDELIKVIKFHYTTAFAHGFKHGIEYTEDLVMRTI